MCGTVIHNGLSFHPYNILPARFSARIAFLECGCWFWRGQYSRNGYGRIWETDSPGVGANRAAHRIIYRMLIGPIPAGLLLDHVKERCALRACVNPWHLEPVTPRENTLRGAAILFKKRP